MCQRLFTAGRPYRAGQSCREYMRLLPMPTTRLSLPLLTPQPSTTIYPQMGPTEFTPETHLDWSTRPGNVTLTAEAGQVILFDYRTRHRGLANKVTRRGEGRRGEEERGGEGKGRDERGGRLSTTPSHPHTPTRTLTPSLPLSLPPSDGHCEASGVHHLRQALLARQCKLLGTALPATATPRQAPQAVGRDVWCVV